VVSNGTATAGYKYPQAKQQALYKLDSIGVKIIDSKQLMQ
jgi:hypothetical protein